MKNPIIIGVLKLVAIKGKYTIKIDANSIIDVNININIFCIFLLYSKLFICIWRR